MSYPKKNWRHNLKIGKTMPQVIWTNFAIAELKNIFLFYRMVAGERTAVKIKKSIFVSTKNPLLSIL
jgi:hypothetical protein